MTSKREPKSDQKPIKIEVRKMDDFRINFSDLGIEFDRVVGVPRVAYLPSVRKVTCRKTNKRGKGKEEEGVKCRTKEH